MADDGTIGQIVYTLKGHEDSVRTCRFSPDSKYLATGDDQGFIKVNLTQRYFKGKVKLKVFNQKGHSGHIMTQGH